MELKPQAKAHQTGVLRIHNPVIKVGSLLAVVSFEVRVKRSIPADKRQKKRLRQTSLLSGVNRDLETELLKIRA